MTSPTSPTSGDTPNRRQWLGLALAATATATITGLALAQSTDRKSVV